jgi:hypothetical protein
MLVISAKGIIYDVPEKELEKHTFPRWIDKKDEITKMFGSLSKVIKESSAGLKIEVEGQGCCGGHPNWCPPGGGNR